MLCAHQSDCILQDDKRVFCREHAYCAQSKIAEEKLAVERRCYIEPMTRHLKQLFKQPVPAKSVYMLLGSMCLQSLGKLEMPYSDLADVLLPVDYW